MTDPQCCRCARPMRHDTALVCSPCANLLRHRLEDVAKIAGDITVTVARLDEIDHTGPQHDDLGWWKGEDEFDPTRRPATNLAVRAVNDRSALAPYKTPPRLDAADRHDAAANELGTWARLIAEERALPIPYYIAVNANGRAVLSHPLARAAWFTAANLEWLRHHPDAQTAVLNLLVACSDLVRVVDSRPPGELVGMCHCGLAVYSDQTGPCRRCGEAVDLDQTREQLMAAMQDRTVTASEAARWVVTLGFVSDTTKLRKLIWAWADRGHLAAVDDTPRYRFGDVLRRVLDSPALLRAA